MGDRVKGKKCLIYGGGTGIGLACAEALVVENEAVLKLELSKLLYEKL